MVNALIFRNFSLPFQIIKESIRHPDYARFNKSPKLLKLSRTYAMAFAMRCSFLLSLAAIYITGRTVNFYLAFVVFGFLTANFFPAISLSIGCGLRNIMSKIVFKEDNFDSLVHPMAMAYLINIVPLWVFFEQSGFIRTVAIIICKFFYAKKTTMMSNKKILVIFTFTVLMLRAISFGLQYIVEAQ